MPRRLQASLLVATLALAGCCRDTIREMASLKDVHEPVRKERSVKAAAVPVTSQSVKAEAQDVSEGASRVETGSISKPACQGQHLAYQATKEYLKNFGPKPPDQPGERGPCNPD